MISKIWIKCLKHYQIDAFWNCINICSRFLTKKNWKWFAGKSRHSARKKDKVSLKDNLLWCRYKDIFFVLKFTIFFILRENFFSRLDDRKGATNQVLLLLFGNGHFACHLFLGPWSMVCSHYVFLNSVIICDCFIKSLLALELFIDK